MQKGVAKYLRSRRRLRTPTSGNAEPGTTGGVREQMSKTREHLTNRVREGMILKPHREKKERSLRKKF